jgi:NAD(P) transhydrogenase subunit beta
MISASLAALLYLVAAILFIFALRGLSGPSTARRGNVLGMIGMTIAVLTTLAITAPPDWLSWVLIVVGIAIGGAIGAYLARTVKMTQMPELIAGFHSLVGFAAVWVAAAALYAPTSFGIFEAGRIRMESLIEMSIGTAIGAFTFTGSIIAFAKLSGRMSGKPIILPSRHVLHIVLGLVLVALIVAFVATSDPLWFWVVTVLALALGFLMIIPIGGADMPVVISMLNSYSGWAAAGIGFTLGNTALIITGALVGSSGAILSYIMCRAMNRKFVAVILGGFGADGGAAAGAEEETRTVKQGAAADAAFLM